jgi:TusA-related sulfurtransferase
VEAEELVALDGETVEGYLLALRKTRAVLDAGGESGVRLQQAMERRLSEMAQDQVLQVISLAPSSLLDVPTWCRQEGHELLRVRQDGKATWFWLRKG